MTLLFIDLSSEYGPGPICAFLSTSDDRFVQNDAGQHVFHDVEDVESVSNTDLVARMKRLLPKDFFSPKATARQAGFEVQMAASGNVLEQFAERIVESCKAIGAEVMVIGDQILVNMPNSRKCPECKTFYTWNSGHDTFDGCIDEVISDTLRRDGDVISGICVTRHKCVCGGTIGISIDDEFGGQLHTPTDMERL